MPRPDGPAVQRTSVTGGAIRNKILCAIPEHEYRIVRSHLECETLPFLATLHESNQTLHHVYFPNAGLVALLVTTEDGRTVEVSVVGKEGMVGGDPVAGGPAQEPAARHRADFRRRVPDD